MGASELIYDVIVVGGGHNGLTAAAYLGARGFKTIVLEKRPIVGGAAVTEEIAPGYRASTASYVVSLLRQEVVDDLELKRYGYDPIPIEASFGPEIDGRYMLTDGSDNDEVEIGKFSTADYRAKHLFEERLSKIADVLRDEMLEVPPRLHGFSIASAWSALRSARRLSRLNREERQLLVQVFTSSPAAILNRWFESEEIKKYYASSVTAGNFASLHTPGGALNLLHLKIGSLEGNRGEWAVCRGGMGAISNALRQSAEVRGVTVRTDAEVARIEVENGRATGVSLADGTQLRSNLVLANTDPKRTFLQLLAPEHLSTEFLRDIKAYRMGSATLRINLALRELPDFAAIPGKSVAKHHRSFIRFMPSLQEMEENHAAALKGFIPRIPIVDAIIPTTLDPSLAPPGGHVLSLLCQHYPYDLAEGHWDDLRDRVADGIISHLENYIPGLCSIVIGRNILTPLDLERTMGLTRGDVYHGALSLDQMASMRPHPDAAQYMSPIAGLYLGGAGSHPGGGVSGAPGYNAAHCIIRGHRPSAR